MTAASSPCISDHVTISPLNKELPSAQKTAVNLSERSHSVTCTDEPDIDNILSLSNYLSTPQNELLLHIDESQNDSNPVVSIPTDLTVEKILHMLSLKTLSTNTLIELIRSWAHDSRSPEINDTLIHTLVSISRNLSSEILLQLLEPRVTLRNVAIGKYQDKSLVVQTTLLSVDRKISISDDLTLIDCGAGGRGYISSQFVDLHKLPCTPLPYHIPIYNVDGTQNKAGAIKRLCTMDMKIGGHSERITFRVTDTGSSNIILGLEWLKTHDPLVNWSKGKLFFINCPSQCSLESTNLCVGDERLTRLSIELR